MDTQEIFDGIGVICGKIQTVSDLFWEFPTNFEWYRNIPVLGNLSLAIILLVGSGIFFTVRLRFIQVRKFSHGIRILTESRRSGAGISPLGAFFLSTAMRVGPGNILGVTGAIAAGGPGALFWMWISAFFSMATAFTESTMAQLFKEKRGDDYVGGFAFYGRRLLKNSAAVGIILSILYVVYALLCFPAQGFNTVSAAGQIAGAIKGGAIATDSAVYWVAAGILMAVLAVLSFGGIRKVSRVTDIVVPVMAVIYILTVLLLIVLNFDRIPWFFQAVFTGAFKPEAVFGGALGTALAQGVRRGLMSNEAGQGTITMPAATSSVEHPCDQGCIQSVGVFLDTIVICTLSAFVVIMGRVWLTDGAAEWFDMGKLPKFVASVGELTPGAGFRQAVSITVSLCFGLFAFTCLLGFMSFTEICATRISRSRVFLACIRILCLAVVAFGVLTSIAGFDLSALWNLSDFANIIMVFVNVPILYIGFKYVLRAVKHFDGNDGTRFTSKAVGIDLPEWK